VSNATNATVDGVRLRIVQPDTAQQDKYKDELILGNWQTLLSLTNRPGLDTITHVIWPEAAPPFILSRETIAQEVIGQLLPDTAVLLTGAVRAEKSGNARANWYNSMHVVSGEGKIIATYDKAHLVPFGEYLPLDSYLEWIGITKIVQVAGRFGSGPGPRTLSIPGTPPFGPLICYEIIFPGEAVQGGNRPEWLLNQTDDSWFGDTSGPRQHLAIARTRAVEEGLPVVRAANTGISTVIDAFGRTGPQLPYGTRDTLDSQLPVALPPTLFAIAGHLFYAGLIVILLTVGILLSRNMLMANLRT
jgi:apolipoprotein N-acyltransferase